MKTTVGQRLKILLERNNLTNRMFSTHVSVKEKQVSNWLKDVSDIKTDHLAEIKGVFRDLNLNWLITGEGNMSLSNSDLTSAMAKEDAAQYGSVCKSCEKMEGQVDLLKMLLKAREDECRELLSELKEIKDSADNEGLDNKKNQSA